MGDGDYPINSWEQTLLAQRYMKVLCLLSKGLTKLVTIESRGVISCLNDIWEKRMTEDTPRLRRMFPDANWDSPEMKAAAEDIDGLLDFIMLLRNTRRNEGVTQVQMAERLSTTQSSISEFERIGGDPRIQSLQRYARAMGYRVRLKLEKVTAYDHKQDQPPHSV
jgi:DNA-binding XRE family transcriptional regulator